MSATIIEISCARFAELSQEPIHDFKPPARAATHHRFAVDHAVTDLTAGPQDRVLPVVRDEQIERAVAVEIGERDGCAAERTRNETSGCGHVREVSVAFVDEE